MVLGHLIGSGGGIEDGEQVLTILSQHPSTAHFIARKLCVRLVADEPPAALVERTAKTFLDTDGDLKAVVKAIVTSPEFFSVGAYRGKIKSPFEYAVSAVRALGGLYAVPDVSQPQGWREFVTAGAVSAGRNNGGGGGARQKTLLTQQIGIMGEPLFSYQAPTGYPEDSRHWVSAGALIARLNFALALTDQRIADATVAPADLMQGTSSPNRAAALSYLSSQLMGSDVSASTRATILKQTSDTAPLNPARMAALILASPEFQRR